MLCLIVQIFLLAATASALEPPAKNSPHPEGIYNLDKSSLYLYDREHHHAHAVKVGNAKILPNRVYMKYDLDLHLWLFVKSDFGANFPTPLEALRPDTVAPGNVIGAHLGLQRFKLTDDGSWLSTKDTEQYKIWVKTDPPQLKTVTYRKLPQLKRTPTQMPTPDSSTKAPKSEIK